MNHYWANRISFKSINKFHNFVLKFCKVHNINETFKNFLEYGDGYINDTYKYLFTANVYYLVNSKAFKQYYRSLDIDFRNDLFTRQEYDICFHDLLQNKELTTYLKQLMKDDSIL